MNAAKMTTLGPIDLGSIEDPSRPVIPFCVEVKDACCGAPHAHSRAQVIFASQGVMRVVTADAIWLVPPSQAVWMPPWEEHQVCFPGEVSVRNLFIDPNAAEALPPACMVFNVTALLRELIIRVGETGEPCGPDSPAARLMRVILDELRQIAPTPLSLPLSDEPRLRKVMEALILAPEDPRPLAEWGRVAGAAARTLARLFVRETGMTFGEWRAQLRMLEAIDRLGQGQPVTRVAFDLGYQNLSAFIARFRKILGTTPGRYFPRA